MSQKIPEPKYEATSHAAAPVGSANPSVIHPLEAMRFPFQGLTLRDRSINDEFPHATTVCNQLVIDKAAERPSVRGLVSGYCRGAPR